jgi:hypothetical protein
LLDLLPKLNEYKAYELLELLKRVKANAGGYVQLFFKLNRFPTKEERKHPKYEIDLLEKEAKTLLQPIIDGKKKTNQ